MFSVIYPDARALCHYLLQRCSCDAVHWIGLAQKQSGMETHYLPAYVVSSVFFQLMLSWLILLQLRGNSTNFCMSKIKH